MTTSEIEKWKQFQIEPIGTRIYVYLDDIPKKSGLIEMIDEQATPSRIGTILALGPEVNRSPYPNGEPPLPQLAVGDRVLIGSHSGNNLYLWQYGIMNERWRVCMRSEIMARVLAE
jgi:co-chaperonin GroES (HSP10)